MWRSVKMSKDMGTHKQLDSRDERYFKLKLGRMYGQSDEEVADNLDFGSPVALYHRLAQDGFPVCPRCGDQPAECRHATESEEQEEQPEPKKRKARGDSKNSRTRSLPRADAAADLFRKALDKLVREVDELEHRREIQASGRFVGTDVYQAAGLMIHRESVTPEYWQELQEKYGPEAFNDAADRFWLPNVQAKQPTGGDVSPAWPLPVLIATYLLSEEPLEPLLEALHADPQSADLEKLRVYTVGRKKPDGRDGLNVLAQQVAALIRGDTPKRGVPPPPLTREEQNVACSVTDYRKQGLSDSEIAKKFAHKGITEHDVRRLGDLGLSWPDD